MYAGLFRRHVAWITKWATESSAAEKSGMHASASTPLSQGPTMEQKSDAAEQWMA